MFWKSGQSVLIQIVCESQQRKWREQVICWLLRDLLRAVGLSVCLSVCLSVSPALYLFRQQ